jgi:hypothetical protein
VKELSCPLCGKKLMWSCIGDRGEAYCIGYEPKPDSYGMIRTYFCGFTSEIKRISPMDMQLVDTKKP